MMRSRSVAGVIIVALTAVAIVGVGGASAQTPPAPTVPVPEELRPLVAALGPVASPVCGAAGLVGVLVSGRGAENPALLELYGALSPVFLTCAYLPPSPNPSHCSADAPIDAAVLAVLPAIGNLVVTPQPAGQTIDSLTAMEVLVAESTGGQLEPGAAALLAGVLACARDDEGGGDEGDAPPPIDLTTPTPAPASPAVEPSSVSTSSSGSSPGRPVASSAPPTTGGAALHAAEPVVSGTASSSAGINLPRTASDWVKLITALCLFALLGPLAAQRRSYRT